MLTYRSALVLVFSVLNRYASRPLVLLAFAALLGPALSAQGGVPERSATLDAKRLEARRPAPADPGQQAVLKQAALETLFNRKVGEPEVRAEVDRLLRSTPQLMKSWLKVSGGDVEAAIDTYVRPNLLDRMLRQSYGTDPAIHAALRQRAEAELATCSSASDLRRIGDEYVEKTYRKPADKPGPSLSFEERLERYLARPTDRQEWVKSIYKQLRKKSGAELERIKADLMSRPLALEETESSFFVRSIVAIDDKAIHTAEAHWFKRGFDQWWAEASLSLQPPSYAPLAFDPAWESAVRARVEGLAATTGSCPALLGNWTYGSAYAVARSGNYAYVNSATWFLVVDVTNPASPSIVGRLNLEYDAFEIVVSGNYAYVAAGAGGLIIVNISNPASPVIAGSFETPLVSAGLTLVGTTAFVADAGSVEIINVTNPAAPSSMSSESVDLVVSVAVSGARLYAGTLLQELKVYNITSLFAPVLMGTDTTTDMVLGLAVSGSYVYAAAAGEGLKIANVSSASSPSFVASCATNGFAQRVRLVSPYAYVADSEAGLAIINIGSPTLPTKVSEILAEGSANDVRVSDQYAYVADGGTGLVIYRIDTPSSPSVRGQVILPGPAWNAAISGSTIYVATGQGGLWIVDATNPASPVTRGFVDTPGLAESVVVSGNYAYVADNTEGIQVIDVSNPDAPVLAATCSTFIAHDVALSGHYLYVADSYSGLTVINVSTPTSPAKIGSVSTDELAYAVALSGNYAYLAVGDDGLRIVDISNPASPVAAGHYDSPGSGWDVAVSGNFAYLADGAQNDDEGWMRVVNVSNPASPTSAAMVTTPGTDAWGISVLGSNVYLADGLDGGVLVYDVSNPTSPALLGSYEGDIDAWNTVAREGLLVSSNGSSGITLLTTCGSVSSCPSISILSVTTSCPTVKLKVNVTDASTQGVTGLTASAFTLTEDTIAKTFMLSSLATAGQYEISYTTAKTDGAQHALDVGVTVGGCAAQHATGNYTLCGGTTPSRVVRVVNASGSPGGTVNVPVEMVSQGNENAIGFSLTYDTAILSAPGTMAGSGAPNATFNANTNMAGKVGIVLALQAGQTFAAGTREVVVVQFHIASTAATSTPIGFGDQPTVREVSDASANVLNASWTGGTVTIASGYEADVAPRPSGNGSVSASDWTQVGRFAAALDTATAGSEFQKADCAPRTSVGNGLISAADWVQAGRYAAGLDPLTAAGGPTSAATAVTPGALLSTMEPASAPRMLSIKQVTLNSGQSGAVPIILESLGNENALGFSVTFDTALLTYTSATLGDGAPGATLNANDSQKASGKVGILIALPAGQAFAAGQRQVVVLNFTAATVPGARSALVSFGDQPIVREVADVTANTLSCQYNEGTVAIVTTTPGYSQQLVFPQFVDGGGFSTRVAVFASPTQASPVLGRMLFYYSDGTARNVTLGGVAGTERLFSLSAEGSQFSASANVGAVPLPGWVLVETTSAVNGMAGFEYWAGQTLLMSASALGVPPSQKFALPVEDAKKTGVAIVNPGSAAVSVRVTLISKTGVATQYSPASLNPLGAKRHVPNFVNELTGQQTFQGTMLIEVVGAGSIAVTGLYQNAGVLSGLPVVIVQ